jgi:4a-hydroxytetrahydrobiopterin dehydratase
MASKKPLTQKEITKRLSALSEWQLNKKETQITKSFATENFISGLSFVAKIAVHAELLNHHPDIELSYQTVKVTLTTHEVKGVTALDFDLAKRIDAIRER